MNNSGTAVRFVLVAMLIAAVAFGVFFYLEWEKPQIRLAEPLEMIGQHKDLAITFVDLKSGIRTYTVSLIQDTREIVVAVQDFPDPGVYEKTVEIQIIPSKLQIADGEANFQVKAVDHSPLRNSTVLSVPVVIDSIPPQISLLTSAHNVNPGGSCLSIYRATKEVIRSGVMVGEEFFPGYPVEKDGTTTFACYFAIPMDVEKTTPVMVSVMDRAGNEASQRIPFYIRRAHTFRSDTVTLSSSFITGKAIEFQQIDRSLAGKTPLEMFMHINTSMRADNDRAIAEICRESAPDKLWDGRFLRMENSATMARFGDRRTYRFERTNIGESVHLGIDLASTRHASVAAANTGTVIFADNLGIYGYSVIIDHGQGIASLYS
ncbi:MAG: M23 family metallopeptidase, partial [Desulfomonilia bacterium]|nr:M23 family metallopeptidase [Desulfomonilia bacterium]